MKQLSNISLKNYTTLNIGGMCKHVFFPMNIDEIKEVLTHYDPIILGCGSNVLINDEIEFESCMILTSFNRITRNGNRVIAQAGARLIDVCNFALTNGLGGLEFAYGIPGSVGGAVFMNAGAYGNEMKDVVECVETLNKTYLNHECMFAYRKSIFSINHELVTQVTFHLYPKEKEYIEMKMKELISKRMEKQPIGQYSAGSTFKRGKDFYASQIINECHLKGYSINDAQVSEKHTGFLINKNNATYKDFKNLIVQVQKKVYNMTHKELECEIKIIGEDYDLC